MASDNAFGQLGAAIIEGLKKELAGKPKGYLQGLSKQGNENRDHVNDPFNLASLSDFFLDEEDLAQYQRQQEEEGLEWLYDKGVLVRPHLTPEQMIEWTRSKGAVDDKKFGEDREFDRRKLEIEQEQARIAEQARRDIVSSKWDHAGRGLANSSIRDVALADIDARSSLARANLSDTLALLSTQRDTAKMMLDENWAQEDAAWDQARMENSRRASENLPLDFGPGPAPPANETQQQKIKRWQERSPMPQPNTEAWRKWAAENEQLDRQMWPGAFSTPASTGTPKNTQNTGATPPQAPGTAPKPAAPKPAAPNANQPKAPGQGVKPSAPTQPTQPGKNR